MTEDDDTPLPLDEAARRAFPAGGADRNSLRRLIRVGKLVGYKPGKAYLTTLRDIRNMLEASATPLTQQPSRKPPTRSGVVPNGLGLTESQIADMSLRHTLESLRRLPNKRKR